MSPRTRLRPALAATACLLVVLAGCSDDGDASGDPTGAAPTSTLEGDAGATDDGGGGGGSDDPTDDPTREPDEEDGTSRPRDGRPNQEEDGSIDLPSPGSDPTDDLPIDAAAAVDACEEAAGEGFTWPDPAEVYYDADGSNVILTADVDADGSPITMVCTVTGSAEDPDVLTLGEI